jgi:hypothetical protein
MQTATLRWGLGLGLAGAALGVVALLIGAFIFPIPPSTTAEAVAVAILVRGVLALLALGVTLGLAYYAGLRVERERQRDLADASLAEQVAEQPEPLDPLAAAAPAATIASDPYPASNPGDRLGSLIAGLLVAFCWWFATSLTGYLFRLLPQTASSAADPSQITERLIWGALIVIVGAGLGGLGSRAPAARTLLDRIITPALPSPTAGRAASETSTAIDSSSSISQPGAAVSPIRRPAETDVEAEADASSRSSEID